MKSPAGVSFEAQIVPPAAASDDGDVMTMKISLSRRALGQRKFEVVVNGVCAALVGVLNKQQRDELYKQVNSERVRLFGEAQT